VCYASDKVQTRTDQALFYTIAVFNILKLIHGIISLKNFSKMWFKIEKFGFIVGKNINISVKNR
jgi:hypothetical protein